ncbi:hypothetical protein OAU26_06000 [Mariniblastus sp.]|jgi:hypothetical protein|nr:hypothetical protein [bacterium]MDA7901841.1 hypothetical protein [bacterium]MDC3224471.1 hypothetical protein [Mariniblastus sp.]
MFPTLRFDIGRLAPLLVGFVLALSTIAVEQSSAQNINVTNPVTRLNDRSYSHSGINFGFGFPGGNGPGSRVQGLGPQGNLKPWIGFQYGGNQAFPIFGGYSPNSGARLDFGRRGPNGGFSFGINMAKGSTRTLSSVAPSLTVQNGFGGTLFNGQTRPFVTGMVPIVGGYPNSNFSSGGLDNGVTRALNSGQLDLRPARREATRVPSGPVSYSDENSSAMTGDLSVSEIKVQREKLKQERNREINALILEAKNLEKENRHAEARVSYGKALRLTKDPSLQSLLKQTILASRAQSKFAKQKQP